MVIAGLALDDGDGDTGPLFTSQTSLVQGLLSLHWIAPTQPPPLQASPLVQAMPSSQGALLSANTQPFFESQVSSVQTLLSWQLSLPVVAQLPFLQPSPVVQGSPSLQEPALAMLPQPKTGWQASSVQGLPSLQEAELSRLTQAPVLPSQASEVHAFLSSQTLALPAQTPFAPASPCVQARPSSQGAVLATEAQPVLSSQVSSVQGLLSLQTLATPVQTPSLQASEMVHAIPSSQAPGAALVMQPLAGSQASEVQGFLSSQLTLAPPPQLPFPQVSPWVQGLPSLQATLLATWVQAPPTQASTVQGLVSSQLSSPMQVPPLQPSAWVQPLPSSHLPETRTVTHPLA